MKVCYAEQPKLSRPAEGNSSTSSFCIATSAGLFIGDPQMQTVTPNKSQLTDKQVRCFWDRVQRKSSIDCWLWIGGREKHGYGRFSMGKRNKWRFAHRVSWALANGTIPKSLCVLHHCDTPLCVNPAHLFLGTRKDNMADCIRKGRTNPACGEQVHSSKLKESQIFEIRNQYEPYSREKGTRALGKKYKVDHSVISEIINEKKWRYLL